ncbi:MAG: Rrf2 family transcriptional regulator [Candidatus Latescibacteria bacterium]|nr:Rrf2 family transcriptional regulator [Candidatus Latescibacterota bacterium]
MLKIPERVNLAIHSLAYIVAQNNNKPIPVSDIARNLAVSESHLAKVMQRLVKVGLVYSTRGAGGGFVLKKNPDTITLMDVYECIEGPLSLPDCLLSKPLCKPGDCLLKGMFEESYKVIVRHMTKTRISDFRAIDKQAPA